MIAVAILLITAGLLIALSGHRLFSLMLPLAGLLAGIIVGFTGVQAVFGAGVIATTVAVIFALFTGLLLALLSYFFVDLALAIVAVSVGISVMSLFGATLGLGDNGVVMFLLALFGAVVAASLVLRYNVTDGIVIAVTAGLGSAFVLAGVLLLEGSVTLDNFTENGIVGTMRTIVSGSVLWALVWFGGTLAGMLLQTKTRTEQLVYPGSVR